MRTERPSTRTDRMTVRRFASSAEADRHDLEFWHQIPERERVIQAWRLSQEGWRLRGDLPDESRQFSECCYVLEDDQGLSLVMRRTRRWSVRYAHADSPITAIRLREPVSQKMC